MKKQTRSSTKRVIGKFCISAAVDESCGQGGDDMVFITPSGSRMTRREYVQYLRRCADSWERGDYCRTPQPEQAKNVREKARRIERGLND